MRMSGSWVFGKKLGHKAGDVIYRIRALPAEGRKLSPLLPQKDALQPQPSSMFHFDHAGTLYWLPVSRIAGIELMLFMSHLIYNRLLWSPGLTKRVFFFFFRNFGSLALIEPKFPGVLFTYGMILGYWSLFLDALSFFSLLWSSLILKLNWIYYSSFLC